MPRLAPLTSCSLEAIHEVDEYNQCGSAPFGIDYPVSVQKYAGNWTWKPMLLQTLLPGESGTAAPPRPGYERMTLVRSQRAWGTVTGT